MENPEFLFISRTRLHATFRLIHLRKASHNMPRIQSVVALEALYVFLIQNHTHSLGDSISPQGAKQ
jgi:hypothetical protein